MQHHLTKLWLDLLYGYEYGNECPRVKIKSNVHNLKKSKQN